MAEFSGPCILTQGLTKVYTRRARSEKGGLLRRKTEQVEALREVSFEVAHGELVGLIGPNGAGKSTTVKLLTGILTPTAGTCVVDGLIPWRDRQTHVRRLGTVFGQRTQLWWDVPIRDSFSLLMDVYRVEPQRGQRRLAELVEALELGCLLDTPLRQLSLGQRMRAELCGSLLHEPSLLFLDEPTIGLDAVSKLRLRAFLKEENQQRGTTILLTTHDMEDMLALCPRVMVLGHGRLLYDGALDSLLRRYDTVHTLRCVFEGEPGFPELPSALSLAREGEEHLLTFSPQELPVDRVLALVMQAGRLRSMTLKEQNVDEMIARMYREMAL